MFKLKKKKQVKKNAWKPNFSKIILSKGVLILLIFLGILALLTFWTTDYLSKSAYFNVESVEIRGTNLATQFFNKGLFEIGKGKNIFTLDLVSIHIKLKEQYPDIQELRVVRVLPNKLIFRIKARRPIAQMAYYNKFYPVDREGVVLSGVSNIAYKELPVISGINARVDECIGKKCLSKQLDNAFLLLDAINSSNLLAEHDLATIDASDYKNISFYIEDGIEIKIGSANFKERLGLLRKTFLDPKINKSEIRYLDLRFEDVTIGPKIIK